VIKCKVKVTDNKKGFNRLVKALKDMASLAVDVGYFGDKKHPESENYTVVGIAGVHEFGAPKANIPERPFMSTTFDERLNENNARIKKGYQEIILGKISVTAFLEGLGELNASWVRGMIDKIQFPPLRAATIARKGSSKPLIDTGTMKNYCNKRIVKI
jgi:hypothetical protein